MDTLFESDREPSSDGEPSNGGETKVVALAPGAEVDALIEFFARIAAELSWQPGDQLGVYQDAALHLAVWVGEELAGGLQVVMGAGEAGMPYRRVWPEAGRDETATAHVTILALEKRFRGQPGLFGPLCVELWRCCRAANVERIVIEATPPTLRLYRRLGWPLKIIGGLRPHWGEECYLCAMGVREVADALAARAERASSYRVLVDQAHRGPLVRAASSVKPSLTGTAGA